MPRAWQSVRREAGWVLALALSIFAAADRLQDLDLYWIHADEGIYFEVAYAPSGRLGQLSAANAHPPGYYLLLRVPAWFGADWATMRGLSAVAGAATVFIGYLVGQRLLGAVAGLAVATLLCLAPGLTVLSQVMRPYALQILLLMIASLFLLRARESERRRDWWAYAAAVIAALSLHYSTLVFIAAAVITLVSPVVGGKIRRRTLWTIAVVHAAIGATAASLYLAHVAPRLMGSGMQRSAQEGWLKEHFVGASGDLLANFAGLQRYLFGQECGGLATVAFGFGLVVLLCVHRRFAILASAALAVAVVLSLLDLYPFGPSRHSSHLLVFSAPVIACGIAWLASRRGWGVLAAVLLVGVGFWQRSAIDAMLGLPSGDLNPRAAESNLLAGHIEAARPKIELLKSGPPCALVVDGYAYGALAPFYTRDNTALAELDGPSFRASRWGHCTILRHQAWTMVTSPENPLTQRHLATLLRDLQTTHPRAAQGWSDRMYVAEVGLFPGDGGRLFSGVLSVPRPMGVKAEPLLALKHPGNDVTLFQLNVRDYLGALSRLPSGTGR